MKDSLNAWSNVANNIHCQEKSVHKLTFAIAQEPKTCIVFKNNKCITISNDRDTRNDKTQFAVRESLSAIDHLACNVINAYQCCDKWERLVHCECQVLRPTSSTVGPRTAVRGPTAADVGLSSFCLLGHSRKQSANICVRTWTCPARLKHTIENHGNVYRNISLAAGAFLVKVY